MACTKQKVEQEKRTIVCGDHSVCSLLPMAVSTSAPVGQTPVLKVTLTCDHLSAMGGMTTEGRIVLQTHDHVSKGPDRFLQVLTREIAGKRLVIWDGAPIHHGQAVNDALRKGGAKRIPLEQRPASVPEVKPQEGVGNLLTRVETQEGVWS